MHKQEFLARLRKRLSGLQPDDIEERIGFYSEMIDDRLEEGLSEEEAVLAVGSVDEIVGAIAPENKKRKPLKAGEIVLLVLGSPVWLSLLIAAASVILSIYVSLWSVIVSLWAVFGSLVACAPGSVAAGVVFLRTDNVLAGIAMFGAAIVCVGLSILMFFGCKAATKGMVILTKKIAVWTKNCFTGREAAQ